MPPSVPLVPSAHLSEFGDFTDSAVFQDPNQYDRDISYVPGYSDMKRARDRKVAEWKAGTAPYSDVRALDLPVNMRWARNQTKKGEPDNIKPFAHGRNGYRLVTKKDIGQPWLKELPAGAALQADGSIRNGDTVLMVCDAQSAAKNVLRKARDTEHRLTGATNAFDRHLQSVQAVAPKGSDPYITKEPVSAPATSK